VIRMGLTGAAGVQDGTGVQDDTGGIDGTAGGVCGAARRGGPRRGVVLHRPGESRRTYP
jgi:hypothetical protein